jgi:DNA-binding GntR family transcriptional regulator
VSDLRSRTSSAPASQWRTRARIEQSAREHHAMVETLAARDAAVLKRILALHIRQPMAAATADENVARDEPLSRSARRHGH